MITNEEIKNEFINCIEESHTLNLAISILEDREELQQENKQLKERLERIENYLDKHYTVENQYWFDHIKDIVKDR